jgi:hypothetical protein
MHRLRESPLAEIADPLMRLAIATRFRDSISDISVDQLGYSIARNDWARPTHEIRLEGTVRPVAFVQKSSAISHLLGVSIDDMVNEEGIGFNLQHHIYDYLNRSLGAQGFTDIIKRVVAPTPGAEAWPLLSIFLVEEFSHLIRSFVRSAASNDDGIRTKLYKSCFDQLSGHLIEDLSKIPYFDKDLFSNAEYETLKEVFSTPDSADSVEKVVLRIVNAILVASGPSAQEVEAKIRKRSANLVKLFEKLEMEIERLEKKGFPAHWARELRGFKPKNLSKVRENRVIPGLELDTTKAAFLDLLDSFATDPVQFFAGTYLVASYLSIRDELAKVSPTVVQVLDGRLGAGGGGQMAEPHWRHPDHSSMTEAATKVMKWLSESKSTKDIPLAWPDVLGSDLQKFFEDLCQFCGLGNADTVRPFFVALVRRCMAADTGKKHELDDVPVVFILGFADDLINDVTKDLEISFEKFV